MDKCVQILSFGIFNIAPNDFHNTSTYHPFIRFLLYVFKVEETQKMFVKVLITVRSGKSSDC